MTIRSFIIVSKGCDILLNREEFENSLIYAPEYWMTLERDELAFLMGSDVALMYGFDQSNPHHCFELFEHAIMTVENLANDNQYLIVAAFLHDIGKPYVAMEKNGRLVFYGHAARSAEIAARMLNELGYGTEEIEVITFYVRHHDDFISYVLPNEERNLRNPYLVVINEENVKKYISVIISRYTTFVERHGVRNLMMNLLDLCEADVRAQSEQVYMNGVLVDSMLHKLMKINAVRREMYKVLGE